MNLKLVGALFIITGCSSVGFSIAAGCRREINLLKSLIRAITFMESELQYRLTPLPDLCRHAGQAASGTIKEILLNFARELDWQSSPNVSGCMADALHKSHSIPARSKTLLLMLGDSLGLFDISGQLLELQQIHTACEAELKSLSENHVPRLRSYQALGICTGAALAILFI